MHKSFAFILSTSLLLIGCSSALQRQLQFFEKTRDVKAARELLELTVKEQPGNSEALFLLGESHFEQHEYAQGHKLFDACRSASTRYESEIDYLLLVSLNSAFENGNVALAASDSTEAIKQYTYATEIDTVNVVAHLGLAQALYKSDDAQGAIAGYRRVLTLDPENDEALNNLSEMLLRGQFYSESLVVSERLLQFHESRHGSKARERLVYAHLALQEYPKADEVFKQIPQYSNQLLTDYAIINYNAGRHAVALRPLIRLASGTDPTGIYSILVGDSYYALGQYRDMADTFERLALRYPKNLEVNTYLVIAYDMLGNKDRANSQREIVKALTEEVQ